MIKARVFSLLMVTVLMLAACGSAPGTPAAESTAAATTAASQAVTKAPAATEAVATEPKPTEAVATESGPTEVPVAATAPPAEAGKTQVIWWYEGLAEPEQKEVQRIFIDSFEAAHPDIDLAIVYQGDNLQTFLRTAIQAGSGPDIIQTSGPDQIAQFVKAGYVAPLDEYVQQYGWDKTIFPWALDVGKVDGKLYSLPLTYETMVLFYNKKVFAENNLQAPKSRADLENAATTLMAKGIWPFANSQSNGFISPVLMSSAAGSERVYQALKGELKWSDPRLVEPISIFNDWMQKGWISGSKESYFSNDYNTMIANFASGKGAMLIMGTWAFRQMNESFAGRTDDWDWIQFPVLRDDVTPSFDLGIGSTLSINGQSKNQQAAAKVLDWIYNDPKRAAEIIQALPGEWVVPIKLDPALFPATTDPRFARALQTIGDASQKGNYGYLPWTFWPSKTADQIYTGLDTVFTKEVTPEQWAKQADEIFAQDLKDGNVPPIPQR